jgi:hypothetical protein
VEVEAVESTWTLIENGQFTEAVHAIEGEIRQRGASSVPSAMEFNHLWTAHMLLGDVASACDAARRGVEGEQHKSDYLLNRLAICRWLLGDCEAALADWVRAYEAQYQDMAGGLSPLMFQVFGAVYLGDRRRRLAAHRELGRVAKRARGSTAWPFPLALYLTGALDDLGLAEAHRLAGGRPPLPDRYMVQACFAQAVLARERGDGNAAARAREEALALPTPGVYLENEYFMLRFWDGWVVG